MLLMETNRRKKEQTTLSGNKPKHETVLFIKATVTNGRSPLEGINSVVKTVFTEISVRGGIEGHKLLRNTKIGSQKAITSALMIPMIWVAGWKYMTCLSKQAALTRPIKGNKPRIFKLIIAFGSNTDIARTVEENTVNTG